MIKTKAVKYTSLYKGGTLKEHAPFLKEAKMEITGSSIGQANAAITGVKAKTVDAKAKIGDGALPPTPKGAKVEISAVKPKTVDSKIVTGEHNTTQGKDIIGKGHGYISAMSTEPKIKGETFNHHGEVPHFESVKAKLKAKFEAYKTKKEAELAAKLKEAETKVDSEVENQDALEFDPEDMGVDEDLSGLDADVTASGPTAKIADDFETFVKDHADELMAILSKDKEEVGVMSEPEASEDEEEDIEPMPAEDTAETPPAPAPAE